MELDSYQNRSSTPYRPPLHNGRLDNSPLFPLLAPPKVGGNSMDHSSPGEIQNAKEETFDTQRLYRFLRRAKWKAYQKSLRHHRAGNYLDMI
jgi:hypothetical protein